ncbi:hypothetical protein DICVIV_08892 [Dictyocaulus viviparus]|uniref:Globin domain-containing protein n=1 Tax=Dictyocaulus viviparus TaxID=29172 RepID=A0A0D8XKJ5_DICVI|nr:hypothetical protein DICVIV_08892 [Dictyocaulus viviparus]
MQTKCFRLFSENPQYKQIWPQFRAIPDSSLTNADQLRKHATVYMCALKNINNSILDENELALQMSLIAMAHIKWNVHRSHIMNMLHPVLDTVKEYNDGEMDANTEAAWTTFYDIIANVIEIFRDKQLE